MALNSHGTNRGAGAPLWRVSLLLGAAAAAAVLVWPVRAQQQIAEAELSPELIAQIEALMAEKAQRTEAQQKVSSHLLQAQKIQRGEPIADGVELRESPVDVEAGGTVTVDVKADVTPEVLEHIDALGGSVVNSVPQYDAIRAELPLAAVEALAELDDVQSIHPADLAFTKGRAQRLEANSSTADRDPVVTRRIDASEGDVAHRADLARRRYRIDGSGIGIGVLSDGVDSIAERQASGDLPATVTVLPDQEGEGDEGTAMLEIVHDLAPGADLFYATAFGGRAQFAANIEALCDAGADVIVDDIAYFAEPPFQNGIVAQGTNAAVGKGCFYFSAAGNAGNLNDGTSGVWEGDFRLGIPIQLLGVPGFTHRFTDVSSLNTITRSGSFYSLKWADPLGGSANDYDLFLLSQPNSEGTRSVRAVSFDIQNGTQDPFEIIAGTRYDRLDTGNALLVLKASGEDRFLHLRTPAPEAGPDRGRPRVDLDAGLRELCRHVGGRPARRGHRRVDARGRGRPVVDDAGRAAAAHAGHGPRHRGARSLGPRFRRRHRRGAHRRRVGGPAFLHRCSALTGEHRRKGRPPHGVTDPYRRRARALRPGGLPVDEPEHRPGRHHGEGSSRHRASRRAGGSVPGLLVGDAPLDWTDPNLGAGTPIKADHFIELRIAVRGLDNAHNSR